MRGHGMKSLSDDDECMNRRINKFCALLVMAIAVREACATPPQIAQFGPYALAPGKPVELTLRGQNLQDPRGVWTSFASRCEFAIGADEASQKGEKLICRMVVPRSEQVGIGALRVVTGEGVSNPVLIMLDDLPTLSESSDHSTMAQAQTIEIPIAVDGQCEPLLEDVYRLHVSSGQRLSLEIVAQRLGSKLDPVVRLLTMEGKELARIDDTAGSGGDIRFEHAFEADGDYLLSVGDVRKLGGEGFGYRLRVGSFPLATAVYPAGGRGGSVMSYRLMGHGSESESTIHVAMPSSSGASRLVSFGLPSSNGAGSGWVQVEASSGAECLEQEPNDDMSTATTALAPGVLNGRLDKAGDRDFFRIKALKGQRVHCVAKTRELGSPCDLFLRLIKPDGSQIAQARQERQTVLDVEIADDGEYLLQVEDLLVGGSAGHVYRIELSGDYDGFSLHAEHPQYTSPQGGTFVVKVLAQRRGYNGPIELAADGLGDDIKLEGNVMEGAETLLKVTLPARLSQGELHHARIVGRAKIGEQEVAVTADQRVPLATLFPNVLSLPTELTEQVAVAVGPAFPRFYDLSVAGPNLYFPQLVGESTFDVEITHINEAFKDPVSLVVDGLPKGIVAEITPVDDGSKAQRVKLAGPVDLVAGEYPIKIVGTGKFQEQTHAVVLDQLKLIVTKPLVVSVVMAGPIVAGGEQQAEVTVQRFGDDPQPVRVHVSDGPPGLLAPIAVTIPGDANKATLPFQAPAQAATGRFDNLVVVATTMVKGQNIAVASRSASVEILPAPGQ